MRILDQFEYLYQFSESEQAVIKWITTHKEDVLTMSTNDLALATFTSPATIVRFCQKLGLKGYNDFKIKLSGEIEYLLRYKDKIDVNYPFNKTDSLSTIANNITQLKKDSMDETLSLINYDDLQKVIDVLYNAKVIDIYATSFPLLYAQNFQLRMMHLGIQVNVCQLHGEPVFQALNSNKDHCAIVISYSGQTGSIISLLDILEKSNTKRISITCLGNNPVASHCHYQLRVSSREKLRSKLANFSSHSSITLLLDILYAGLYQKQYDMNTIYKISREKTIDNRRSTLKTIDEK